MFGAIIGDIVGSVFESETIKTTEFPLFSRYSRFTDDTVLTVAVADTLLHRSHRRIMLTDSWYAQDLYTQFLRAYGRRFPQVGYGQMFESWLSQSTIRGYRSYANGAAMRVSPIGFACSTLEEVLREAKLSASVTHNHRKGIRGAQAIAAAIYLAKEGESKTSIRQFISSTFGYYLAFRLDDIRQTYAFDSSADGSVPQALVAFFESNTFEDAIRKAISLGGDSDTLACMTGGIAQAYYKYIPSSIVSSARLRLDSSLKDTMDVFNKTYKIGFS